MQNLLLKKFCKSCTRDLVVELFGYRKASTDGLTATCRACTSTRNRLKYWADPVVRAKSKEKSISSKQRRFASDPAYKKAFRLWCRVQRKSKAPPWVAITDFVPVCKKLLVKGEGYELDHTIPLRGADVCGLHVPSNVRVVLKTTNAKKGNSFVSDWHTI